MEEYVISENLGELLPGGIGFVSAEDFKIATRNCLKAPNDEVVGFIVKEDNLTPETLEKMRELEAELGIPLHIIKNAIEI